MRSLEEADRRDRADDERASTNRTVRPLTPPLPPAERSWSIASGMPATMPAKMISDDAVADAALGDQLAEPHDDGRAGGQRDAR